MLTGEDILEPPKLLETAKKVREKDPLFDQIFYCIIFILYFFRKMAFQWMPLLY